MLRVLLIGKGAREHALAMKLRQSSLLSQLYFWPGHGGMAPLGECLNLPASATFAELGAVAKKLAIDLVVCGPEGPLAAGLADHFLALGIKTFGSIQAAAALESSKMFAKEVMQAAGIPTAAYVVVQSETACRQAAQRTLQTSGGVVLKASGLAAGKGVFVCFDAAAIEAGLRHLYHTDMVGAAQSVVVEQVLRGRECSYFSLVGADGVTELGFAVDYKRLKDGDCGPNTGGMGCYTPVPWLPADAGARIERVVVQPLLRELKKRGIAYCGALFVGVMWNEQPEYGPLGPQVIEFNVRFGDPEAQVLTVADSRDWLALMASKAGLVLPEQALCAKPPACDSAAAVAVVLASAGYPYGENEQPGVELPGSVFAARQLGAARVQVFGAAINQDKPPFITGSGRVLTVTARSQEIAIARSAAYQVVGELSRHWPECQWRSDIAGRAIDCLS